jgi:hypothetical protein
LFEGSTAGHDDSCLLARKLKEFEAAGFIVKDGQKSIHDENSIRFMREVIGMSKWHEEVKRGVRLSKGKTSVICIYLYLCR